MCRVMAVVLRLAARQLTQHFVIILRLVQILSWLIHWFAAELKIAYLVLDNMQSISCLVTKEDASILKAPFLEILTKLVKGCKSFKFLIHLCFSIQPDHHSLARNFTKIPKHTCGTDRWDEIVFLERWKPTECYRVVYSLWIEHIKEFS